LPKEVFVSGAARWLGVRPEGQPEQSRVLLLSVPYALKAADAETVGGLPPSAFARATDHSATTESARTADTAPAAASSGTVTSVGLSAPPADFTVTGSPVTTKGTLGLNWKVAPTSASTANAIVKRDASGNFNANSITATGTLKGASLVAGGTAPGTIAIHGDNRGAGFSFGVEGDSAGTSTGSAGVLGIDDNGSNTTAGIFTIGVHGISANPKGMGALGYAGGFGPTAEFNKYAGIFPVGVWGDGQEIGLFATSDRNAIWAVNNNANGYPTVYVRNETTANNSYLFYATAPNVAGSPTCSITTNADLNCSGNASIGGNLGIGTTAPQAELNLNKGGSATADTLLIGNNSTKGLRLRDSGSALDIESIGADLYINNTTQNKIFVNGTAYLNKPVIIGGGPEAAALSVYNPGGNVAGYFSPDLIVAGDVIVQGHLSKHSGSFKIDHPLDPANKYLYHSFVESPDMMNVYNGNVSLDQKGEAVVLLPAYFEALNKDFRYQLTAIGGPGPNLYVAEEVHENQFRIAGGAPGLKVSWQVTGVRQDAWANAHRIRAEVDKPENEHGYYLAPELFGAPKEKGIQYAARPPQAKPSNEAQQRPEVLSRP
jgi:hypothetical protein